jgi:hypothetical protein
MTRVLNQFSEPFLPGFFFFSANYPPSGGSSIPRCLGLKETPSSFMGSELLLIGASQLGGFPLLIRIYPRLRFLASPESLEASGPH